MSLILDTGPLLALLDADDDAHAKCARLIVGTSESLIVPSPVLVELDYWCRKLLGVEVWQEFLKDLDTGAYHVFNLDSSALRRAAELEAQYNDLGLGMVDAAVITSCELLGEKKVVTLDRRHFSVVRPNHCDSLTLLPE